LRELLSLLPLPTKEYIWSTNLSIT